MRDNGSLRGRLLGNLALLLVVLMLASGLSAYWNGREAADTAYDRTLLASARTIAAGLSQRDGSLSADVPYVALDTFAYDSAGRIYYQVLDIQQRLISGYENLPAPPPGTPRTDDYPALARFYNATYLGQDVRVVLCCSRHLFGGKTGTRQHTRQFFNVVGFRTRLCAPLAIKNNIPDDADKPYPLIADLIERVAMAQDTQERFLHGIFRIRSIAHY